MESLLYATLGEMAENRAVNLLGRLTIRVINVKV